VSSKDSRLLIILLFVEKCHFAFKTTPWGIPDNSTNRKLIGGFLGFESKLMSDWIDK